MPDESQKIPEDQKEKADSNKTQSGFDFLLAPSSNRSIYLLCFHSVYPSYTNEGCGRLPEDLCIHHHFQFGRKEKKVTSHYWMAVQERETIQPLIKGC